LGHLKYVNKAGGPIVETWGLSIGQSVAEEVVSQTDGGPLELIVGSKTYSFHVVMVPEFECLNIYATDISAAKDNALACVRMAMEMKASLRKVRALWRDRGLTQSLDVRVGIHTDTCTVGNFGSRDRLDYTTIGNGVNLASRLESNARPNQILISEDTYLLIRDTIRCEKLERITVKSITQPVQTYEVDGEVSDESALRRVEKHMDGFSLYIDPDATDHLSEKRDALQRALRLIDRLD
jgi:class 3 adenylate cyclase